MLWDLRAIFLDSSRSVHFSTEDVTGTPNTMNAGAEDSTDG